MKAVILVGGEATRLRPLTYNMPKAMVPVLNTPFLEHVIRHLSSHRIADIILAQDNRSQSIQSYFGDGSQFGVRLHYSIEDIPLGTAGAVKLAEKHLDGTFLVLNGDVFTDLDITAMLAFHRERKAKVTIALTPVDDPTSYGLIESDAQGMVTRFLEKPSREQVTTNMINAGTYILEPDVLGHIPPRTNSSFERGLFPLLLEQGEPVYAYASSTYWIDIGAPERYLQLNRDLLSGVSLQYSFPTGETVLVGEQCSIDPTAEISGPVIIGNNCTIGHRVKLIGPVVIGPGSTILEDSVVEASIIWQNSWLGERVALKNSIVAQNCRLSDDCRVTDSVLGGNVTVVSGAQVASGRKIGPGTTVPADT